MYQLNRRAFKNQQRLLFERVLLSRQQGTRACRPIPKSKCLSLFFGSSCVIDEECCSNYCYKDSYYDGNGDRVTSIFGVCRPAAVKAILQKFAQLALYIFAGVFSAIYVCFLLFMLTLIFDCCYCC